MMLYAFLYVCYFAIASVMAKSYSSLLINGNDKNVNFYVQQDSKVSIGFTGNSGGYYDWSFDNIEDLKNYDIEVSKNYNYNAGVYSISFDITNGTSIEELPTLQFTYKDDAKEEVIKQVQITLKEQSDKESVTSPFDDIKIFEEGGDRDIYIRNEYLYIQLYTTVPVDRPLTTGYSWYLDNADMLRNNKIVKFLRSNSYYRNGSEMECIFEFKVNEIGKEDLLPALLFSLKQSSDDSSAKAKSIVNLRLPDEKSVIFTKDDLKQHLNVNKNETIIVELDGNPSTGYNWYLENADEIKASELIEPLNLKKNDNAPAVGKGVAPGSPATYKFKFYIKETVESDQTLPTLKFIQAKSKSGSDIVSTAELSLKAKKERKEEKYDPSLPVYVFEENNELESVLYVESNSIVKIVADSNASTGHQWFFDNSDEIDRSDAIDYIGQSYQSSCSRNCPPGTGGTMTYSYRIWDVTSEDELPMIKMTYRQGWDGGAVSKIIRLTLKLKKDSQETKECSVNGYPCCTKADAKVYYEDKDGEWSVENGDWCIIKKQEDEKKEDEQQLSCGNVSGYPCCEKQEVKYTDDTGKWGYENNNWCVIKTCSYTGPYPICKTTTKVVYTDSEKWGVENNEWCVLCF